MDNKFRANFEQLFFPKNLKETSFFSNLQQVKRINQHNGSIGNYYGD
jgi:hypothetical protein